MSAKRLVVGCVALVTATLWSTLLVAQAPRLALGLSVLAQSAEPVLVRVMGSASVLLSIVGAIVVLPLALAGIGLMLGMGATEQILRLCCLAGLLTAGFVVTAFGAVVLPSLGTAGALRLGSGTLLDLVGAANLLLLHGTVLAALTSGRFPTPRLDAV